MKRTLLYSLLLLALTACQDYITPEVPKDDLSSWMNEEAAPNWTRPGTRRIP